MSRRARWVCWPLRRAWGQPIPQVVVSAQAVEQLFRNPPGREASPEAGHGQGVEPMSNGLKLSKAGSMRGSGNRKALSRVGSLIG